MKEIENFLKTDFDENFEIVKNKLKACKIFKLNNCIVSEIWILGSHISLDIKYYEDVEVSEAIGVDISAYQDYCIRYCDKVEISGYIYILTKIQNNIPALIRLLAKNEINSNLAKEINALFE